MSTTTISHTGARLPQALQPSGDQGGAATAAPAEAPRQSPRGAGTVPNWLMCVPFVLLHLAPLAIFWTGVDLRSVLLCVACYLINMVGITARYHRYFPHPSYK